MDGWTRRSLGAAGLGLMATGATVDPLSGAALYADVVRYDGLGEHRTGTAGDLATNRWMQRELAAAGYAVEAQDFAQPVFELASAEVVADGKRIAAFPLWTPKAAEAAGPLASTARPGAIALLSFPAWTGAPLGATEAWRAPVQRAIDAGASAVIAITENVVGELAACNTLPNLPPWKVPVVVVAGRDGPALRTAVRAQVVVKGRARPGASNNLIARTPGPGKPLIVSTPKSGWFHCAGERGSGLAIWLGLARHFARSGRNLILMAASGHELDGYGGHLFAEHLAPKPADARGWLHIGANVAAYDFALVGGKITRLDHPQAGRRLAVSEALLPVATANFAGQIGYGKPVDVEVEGAPGELAEYQRRGYHPLVGMVGLHPLHHTPRDRADVTGPELLEPVARGLAAVIERL